MPSAKAEWFKTRWQLMQFVMRLSISIEEMIIRSTTWNVSTFNFLNSKLTLPRFTY